MGEGLIQPMKCYEWKRVSAMVCYVYYALKMHSIIIRANSIYIGTYQHALGRYTLVSCVHHLLKNKVHPLPNVLRIDVFCHRVETITLVRDSYLNLTEDHNLPWHTVSIAIVMRKKVMIYGANNFLVSVLSWHADYRYYIT